MNNNILLESGTGELEIIEFIANGNHYAINVVKVKEVIEMPSNLTKLPDPKPEIAGLILCRDEILTLIDLKYILTKRSAGNLGSKVIVCEFNKIKVSFNIDDIVGVHRIRWDEIRKPDDLSENSLAVGNILLNGKVLIMLDFEKIVTDICPSVGISEERLIQVDYKDRSSIKLVMADDSALIRRLLKDTLTKAGFKNLRIFDDGKQALDFFEELARNKGENFIKEAQLLITDIEMPQMDGLTLTRKIKENETLKKLPIVIFSSLITGELRHKGESVGANAQLSKPEVSDLVDTIDKLLGV
ncbi:chemotaxis protein [Clostridium beijerinckii]|uniref:Stage 0 sporulation protein A homolog n=1 Tax=Clostridium beijerinckii TaxID=1520 RepID=A0AAX0B3K3_CLOBE|nr:chemotaxis protein [Clostridium beijerinckii]MBA8937701.1 two-component system chemotaxis response regulator CheV [Clostridium beijerinckii]NRT33079.1 two-component system chemotaxis response regulator CheV [Clostridium beijerinckii]NRT47496.1 two-component system chemotaxis response regulator CheV [Clostridium beijerinckii]NRT89616.1 two-component system chemotaxis response regulator CheV [Clostridium beijerinckii]NRU41208.1 two-component system chemotaxis response regulator CheV [Clostrid